MNKLRLLFDEQETMALLLMVHAASEITWTDADLRSKMQQVASRIEVAVYAQLPHLKTFLQDKEALIGDFS